MLERFAQERETALKLYDERFCRMWEFYLAACEMAFRNGRLMVFQIQLAKRRDSVPLTRDYIAETEAGQIAGNMSSDTDTRRAS
ncbi:MAG: cyclopropane fatty acyl phospholipid synthase [Nitrospira sp. OLB3]|nr:MAG: cyclopropane fatty acyl phospholipid synthase [Nitrospira sp. OLB3]